ncbi:MAG: type II toxin-antitoxin system VapC family toxin [Deltaproteobacteria bacterium]|nr:type II toxin-antitoxin system VapC family toxin [Deltaproteobacteria bacterium]
MKKFFLDTSAYSLFKRGNAALIEKIKGADEVYLNAIVIGELLAGFDGGKFREVNRRELREFLEYPMVVVTPITEETSEKYSLIYNDLKNQGTPIPTNDLWIAASVMETGTCLMTADQHFQKVRQIQMDFTPHLPGQGARPSV